METIAPRDRGKQVRPSLRLAMTASFVLLASWSLPTANGEFLTLLEDKPPYVAWSPDPEPPWEPPSPVTQPWPAAALSQEGTCFYITAIPVPGGGVAYGADDPDDHPPSCHHDDRPSGSPSPNW